MELPIESHEEIAAHREAFEARNAALEEAAKICDGMAYDARKDEWEGHRLLPRTLAKRIRALKSSPAPQVAPDGAPETQHTRGRQ